MKTDLALITPKLLRKMPLPLPREDGDKEARGRVLVVGGGRETPGAVLLAGEAALRAGAGKLQIATGAGNAAHVAASIPEARVLALPETKTGTLLKSGCARLEEHLGGARSICVGPGMIEEAWVVNFVAEVLRRCAGCSVLLDAGAIACLGQKRRLLEALEGRVVVTPNAEELADIYGARTKEIERAPLDSARRAAKDFRAVVVLKGRETFIASPAEEIYVNRAGCVGLATSGSGDVLAGIIAGLIARGTDIKRAAAWGVYLHARAGERLSERTGPLGFLARELSAEIPALMWELGVKVSTRSVPLK
jgi:ADP-dependent NAD(P)H-hydrate dehydratase